jgi:AraC-like DNA-binding protein
VTLGTTADRAELARNRGIRAARLEGIKADIIARVGDGKLSAGAVAARHALALRSLQKLFEAAGTTFSEFLLDQRLARAYRALTNRLHARRSISEIAYDSGFNDLSYFNRAFRRRYGATPSDVRHGP